MSLLVTKIEKEIAKLYEDHKDTKSKWKWG